MKEEEMQVMETGDQTPDMGQLWDGSEEDMTGQGGDQPLEEPGEGGAQTSGEPASEEREKRGEADEEGAWTGARASDGAEGSRDQPETEGKRPTAPSASERDKAAQETESFTLRHMDDPPITVDREGVIRLAQQGLDYERVRTERDQLREYRAQADPALNLVRTFAENSGMTLEAYVDYCRTQALVAQGVNEATAKAQVEMEKQQAKINAQTRAAQAEQQRRQAAEAQAQEKAEAQKRDMVAFLGAYPDVKADDIPKEVWQKVAGGESLVNAYTMYQNQQLRAKMAAMEQNKETAAKALGSLGTRGEKGQKTLADLWDEAED